MFGLNNTDKLHSIAYTDDLIIYKADNDIDIILTTLQEITNKINLYYKEWNLKINPTKCEIIFFRRPVKQIKYSAIKKINKVQITAIDVHNNQTIQIPKKKKNSQVSGSLF